LMRFLSFAKGNIFLETANANCAGKAQFNSIDL